MIVAIEGIDSGTNMRHSVVQCVAPSTNAASSRSLGSPLKRFNNKMTLNTGTGVTDGQILHTQVLLFHFTNVIVSGL
jgi:hypothetical protein